MYWCLVKLRSRGQSQTETVLKDDSLCKLRLIRVLKKEQYDPKTLNIFLEVSAENSIPLSYVEWFYEDKRAALWLNMVLKKTINLSNRISIKSDITIFIHDIIFNINLVIQNKRIVESYSDSQIALKKIALDSLKGAYLLSKVNSKDIKWLTSKSNSRVKINYVYQYMQKFYDLNNLKKIKSRRKDTKSGTKILINMDTSRL